MKQTDNTHSTAHNLRILTANVNGLNNPNKRNKTFNLLKTKKTDLALLQETHLTKTTETQWQKEWAGISFWNSGPTHQSAGVAILLNKNFECKIQNIAIDNIGRYISISFIQDKQTFQIVNLYGPNKPFQRENFFQQLNNYVNSTQNTIIGGDFNMVTDLKDRIGGSICYTHLVGSSSLNKILNNQKLYDTWRKVNPKRSEFTYHRPKSNIHSRIDRSYAPHNLRIIQSYILPFQYTDHEALITEFILRSRIRGPGYWKLNTSILEHKTFKDATQNFCNDWQNQKVMIV